MKPDQASKTAEYMALFRALESAKPPRRRLFLDPYARRFLHPSLLSVAQLARFPLLRGIPPWLIDTLWPGARTSAVARTRWIDDLLLRSIADGVQQVVILGAGFDCRAYRLPALAHLPVLEVDHPDTLRLKRERLQQLLGERPTPVKYVALDFNQKSLDEALVRSRFHGEMRTFFLWEGVTNYLRAEAVDATFCSLRRLADSSLIVFTYVDKSVLEPDVEFAGRRSLQRALRRAGEGWTFGLVPDEVGLYLKKRGFRLLEDVDSLTYRRQYLMDSPRELRGYEFYHVAQAESA